MDINIKNFSIGDLVVWQNKTWEVKSIIQENQLLGLSPENSLSAPMSFIKCTEVKSIIIG